MKIAIVDYGLGNLFSIENACRLAGHEPFITSDKKKIEGSDSLILPGVGAFGDAINSLNKSDLTNFLINYANSGRPFMGICLGMQLLFSESEEFGTNKGLGLIEGRIIKFEKTNKKGQIVKVPQIQWNTIMDRNNIWKDTPFKEIPEGAYMQFVHSFYAVPSSKDYILSETVYGSTTYASAVISKNVIGIQFHPEKSGEVGLSIYKNWK
jgi:glutamine amidotransferase